MTEEQKMEKILENTAQIRENDLKIAALKKRIAVAQAHLEKLKQLKRQRDEER